MTFEQYIKRAIPWQWIESLLSTDSSLHFLIRVTAAGCTAMFTEERMCVDLGLHALLHFYTITWPSERKKKSYLTQGKMAVLFSRIVLWKWFFHIAFFGEFIRPCFPTMKTKTQMFRLLSNWNWPRNKPEKPILNCPLKYVFTDMINENGKIK